MSTRSWGLGLAAAMAALATAGWMWWPQGIDPHRSAARLTARLPATATLLLRPELADCPVQIRQAWQPALSAALAARNPIPSDLDDDAVLALPAGSGGDGVLVAGACHEMRLRLVAVDLASGRLLAEETAPMSQGSRRGTGQVLVTSRPGGARVLLDGREAGRTPLLLTATAGNHALRLEDERVRTVEDVVVVKAGGAIQRRYEMATGSGRLAVVTSPSGAELWLDGSQLPERSPALLGPIAAGVHRLEARLAGASPQAAEVAIPTDRTKRLELSFPEAPAEPPAWRDPASGIEFVRVPGGCFRMGCGPWTEDCDPDEKQVHDVCLDPFWISRTEVTAAQWRTVTGRLPPGRDTADDRAAGQISWNDAHDFLARLNGKAGAGFRLPTEAEWEYACRSGGRDEKYPGGTASAEHHVGTDYPHQFGWIGQGANQGAFPVGVKQPNGLGLHDMAGNVWEWTADSFLRHAYQIHQAKNPVELAEGAPNKVVRGGSFNTYGRLARCSHRDRRAPDYHSDDVGMRVVRSGQAVARD